MMPVLFLETMKTVWSITIPNHKQFDHVENIHHDHNEVVSNEWTEYKVNELGEGRFHIVTPLFSWNLALGSDALQNVCCHPHPPPPNVHNPPEQHFWHQKQRAKTNEISRCPSLCTSHSEQIKSLRKFLTMHNLSALLCSQQVACLFRDASQQWSHQWAGLDLHFQRVQR